MNSISFVVCSLFSAILSGLAAGYLTERVLQWYRVPINGPGVIMYFVVSMIPAAIFGGVVGLALPSFLRSPSFFHGMASCTATLLGISAVVFFGARQFGHIPPTLGGRHLFVDLEFRAGSGFQMSNRLRSGFGSITLSARDHSGKQIASTSGKLEPANFRKEGGRIILPAEVFLFTQKGSRHVVAELNARQIAEFSLPLAAHPSKQQLEWSNWITVSPAFEYRFRVRKQEDPVEVTYASFKAELAAFESIGDRAPIEKYFPYAKHSSFEINNKARLLIASRPMELLPILEKATESELIGVMEFVILPNPLPAEFEPVLLRILNQMTAKLELLDLQHRQEDDPDAKAAQELQRLFINWSTAWNNCNRNAKRIPGFDKFLKAAEKCDEKELEAAHNIATLAREYHAAALAAQ